MGRFSVLLLVLLGVVVVAAGLLDLLREAQILVFSFTGLGSVLIVLLGIWIVVCAVECKHSLEQEQLKS